MKPSHYCLPTIDWKAELRTALRTAAQLVEHGFIPASEQAQYERLLQRFPLVLPLYYANLIDRSNPACPIRLQAIPQLQEAEEASDMKADPLEDLAHRPAPRITHRYPNRALLHLTPNCSMNCRYCFRKSLLNESREDFFEGDLPESLRYLQITPQIEEVIFSGGDPFLANESTLGSTLRALHAFPHVKRVRFHSRVPVTLPMRVTACFSELLMAHGKTSVVVTHFNHPRELTSQASEALRNLKSASHTLLNQSVLLQGVNDSVEVLKQLSERLFEEGVLPYYLHHPDRALGTKHFDVSTEVGRGIHRALRCELPGYLVPRYVVDDPSFAYKQDA